MLLMLNEISKSLVKDWVITVIIVIKVISVTVNVHNSWTYIYPLNDILNVDEENNLYEANTSPTEYG